MLTTRYRTEEILSQLRQAEVELSRGWWRGSARWRPSMGGMAIGGSRGWLWLADGSCVRRWPE